MFSDIATSRQKILRNCRSLSVKACGCGLSTLNVPITSLCSLSGTVSELLAPVTPVRYSGSLAVSSHR